MPLIDMLLELVGVRAETAAHGILRVVIGVLVVFIAANLVAMVFRRVENSRRRAGRDFGYVRLFKYIVLAFVYVGALAGFFSATAKDALSAILASSGIAAVVLSIACQEPIGNLCSGVIIILTHPFRSGDLIRLIEQNVLGTVEEITLRHTVLRTFENKRLIIPNSSMNKATVENANYMGEKLCVPMEFMITYDSNVDAARQIVHNAILRHPKYDEEKAEARIAAGKPPFEVRISRMDTNGIVLRVWVWAADIFAASTMKSDIYSEVWRRFGYAGVEFAYSRVRLFDGTEGKRIIPKPPTTQEIVNQSYKETEKEGKQHD